MKIIRKYNVYLNTWENIALPGSALVRYLDAIGKPDALIKVGAVIPEKNDVESEIKAAEAKVRLDGVLRFGIEDNGIKYRAFCAGSSDIRNGAFVCLDETVIPQVGSWIMCGLKANGMNIYVKKLLAYMGLVLSSTRDFSEVFGNMIDINRVVVVPDYEVNVSGIVDFVDESGVRFNKEETVAINAFDGAALIDPRLTNGQAATLRTSAAGMKICAFPVDYKAFAKAHGIREVKDLWDVSHKIENVDLILTESCFKFAKQTESWREYVAEFKRLGHEFLVCVQEHAPALKALSYQAMQTLVAGNRDDALHFVAHAKRTVLKYRQQKYAANLLGKHASDAAKLYPDLMDDPWHEARLQAAYRGRRDKMIGGKVPALGYNAFLAPDIVAMMQAIFGLPVVGVLKAGECSCNTVPNGSTDVVRYPHLGHEHVILQNKSDASWYFTGPTFYLNIWDFTTVRLRADYDGDHVWFSQDAHLLRLIRKTDHMLGNIAVDWIAPKAAKVTVTSRHIRDFLSVNTQGSQIGIYADNFTKFWGQLPTLLDDETITLEEARKVWCWLEWAGNVLIDSAKHGSAKVAMPKYVRKYTDFALPAFCEYAKSDKEHPVGSDHWQKRCSHSGGFVDRYSDLIRENVPETLEIEEFDKLDCDFRMLQIEPGRKVGRMAGLWRDGRHDRQTGAWVDRGFFNEIAFRHSEEYKIVERSDNMSARVDWDELRGKQAFEEIKAWAEEREGSIEEAYDVIVVRLFTMAADRKRSAGGNVLFQAFWRIFGEMAVEAVRRNTRHINRDYLEEEFVDDLADLDRDFIDFED